MTKILWIALGAALGANARYFVGNWAIKCGETRFGLVFPYSTFVVNIAGSFILGFVAAFLIHSGEKGNNLRLLIAVGFLGSFTTFSSFSLETLGLIEGGKISLGLINIAANNFFGLLMAFLGLTLARFISG